MIFFGACCLVFFSNNKESLIIVKDGLFSLCVMLSTLIVSVSCSIVALTFALHTIFIFTQLLARDRDRQTETGDLFYASTAPAAGEAAHYGALPLCYVSCASDTKRNNLQKEREMPQIDNNTIAIAATFKRSNSNGSNRLYQAV